MSSHGDNKLCCIKTDAACTCLCRKCRISILLRINRWLKFADPPSPFAVKYNHWWMWLLQRCGCWLSVSSSRRYQKDNTCISDAGILLIVFSETSTCNFPATVGNVSTRTYLYDLKSNQTKSRLVTSQWGESSGVESNRAPFLMNWSALSLLSSFR